MRARQAWLLVLLALTFPLGCAQILGLTGDRSAEEAPDAHGGADVGVDGDAPAKGDASPGTSTDGDAGDAAFDAPIGFCQGLADAGLFCDDFETPGVSWGKAPPCPGCTLGVTSTQAHSLPNSLLVAVHNVVAATGSAEWTNTWTGSFTGATLRFALYVERFDTSSIATVQELGLENADNDRVRMRLLVHPDKNVRVEPAVNYQDGGECYDDVPSFPLDEGTWYVMEMTLSAATGFPHVTLKLNGTQIIDHTGVCPGAHAASTLALRNGVRYTDVPTDTTGWKLFFDDVAVYSP
jgi:hypothetical protein